MRLFSFLRSGLATFVAFGIALALMLASPATLAAITFDNTPSGGTAAAANMELIRDTVAASPTGQYVGLRFSSNVALTNVYARAIVGGVGYSLDATELQDHAIGDLSATATTSFWFINIPATTANGTFQVQIYSGGPPGVGTLQGTSTSYGLVSADVDQSAAANKISSVVINGGSGIVLGQDFNAVVCYDVNSANGTNIAISPAATSAFDPTGLQLLNVPSVQAFGTSGCTGTLLSTNSNQLYYTGIGNGGLNSMRATYTFRAMNPLATALSPIVSARSGQYKYNSDFSTFLGSTVPAASNAVTLAKSVSVTESPGAVTALTYTITATNTASVAVMLDSFIDTLPSSPAAVTYVTGSAKFNGAVIANPTASGQVLTWSNPGGATAFSIPANSSRSLTFQANIPANSGAYTNSVIAKIGTVTIDTTLATGDNVSATATTRVGPPVLTVSKTADTPTIVITAAGTTATYTIKVANTGTTSLVTKLIETGLPTNFAYASTVAINTPTSGTCATAATRTAVANPTAGVTAPVWGDFTIPGGCEVSVQFIANVTSAVADGTYNNSANTSTTTTPATITNFDGTPAGTTSDNVTVTSAVLAVTKTSSTPAIVNTASGSTATYTLTATNSGTANATGVKVVDQLPAGFTYGSTSSVTLNGAAVAPANFQAVTTGTQTTATPQWDTNPTGGFTINAGQTLVITFVANVANTVADGTYNNSATISAGSNAKTITNFDGIPAGTTSDNVTVTSAVLAVTKTTSSATVTPSGTATYTVTVTNSGSAAATGVKVIDTLAAGFAYAATTSVTLNGSAVGAGAFQAITSGAQTPATPQWDTNPTGGFTINAAQTLVIVFTATAPASTGTYNNSAAATSTNAKTNMPFDGTANTADDVTVSGVASPILTVSKTTSTATVTPSGTATYTVTVTNSGSAAATGVKVIDTLAAGFAYAATTSVTLNGSAVGAGAFQAITSGAQTPATPQWDTNPTGGFTINAAQTLVIVFTATAPATTGTYNNSAAATSTNTASITNFNGAASTADDVTVAPAGVALTGTVYSDANHNTQHDGGESGTGQTIFAKLINNAAPTVALQAVAVNPATGAYSFGSVTPGSYTIILDDNNALGDVSPAVPGGWLGTEMPGFSRTNIQVASSDVQNLNFGLFNGSTVSGSVFADTGIVGGIANNGIKDGGEPGIAGVTVKASTGATTYDSTMTDGAGSYALWIPAAATSPVVITETNLGGYLSTGGGAGTTAGTYTRTSDSTGFTFAAGVSYINVNFADVPVNRLIANGQQTGSPGNALFYPHQFNAGSGGTVSFSVVSASGWPVILYRDSNCNGVIDSSENVISAAITVLAAEQVCLINKVTIPAGTALGVQDIATVQASFTYTNANPALLGTALVVLDTSTAGVGSGGLVLTKTADRATALPGETITYTITYKNNGSTPVGIIIISDATPAFTTFVSAGCTPPPTALTQCTVTTSPAPGGGTSIQWTLTGSLNPASVGQVVFAVKVNN